jgi:hypothetical protein
MLGMSAADFEWAIKAGAGREVVTNDGEPEQD